MNYNNHNYQNRYNNAYQMGGMNGNPHNNIPTNGMNQTQQPYSEYMKYTNYYNPLIIQNYYAMFNQMNYMQPNTQFGNYFSSPYTMNNRHPGQMQHNQVYNIPRANNVVYKSTNNPELDEEIRKWIDSRKRNFPTDNKVTEKNTIEKVKEDSGMLSKLEIKLRQKVKILSQIDKKSNRNNRNNRPKRQHRPKRKHNGGRQGLSAPEEAEDGEIVELKEENKIEKKAENVDGTEVRPKKEKNTQKQRRYFRYRKNKLYEELIRPDKIKEMNIILQAFRYFVNENLV
jgi:hypothetical protein